MCRFSFSQSTFRFPPFNQGYCVRRCHSIYLYLLFPMEQSLWGFSDEGLQQKLVWPSGGLWAFAATSCVCKGEWNGEALGWLSAGAPQTVELVGGPLQSPPPSLADAASPLQLLLPVQDFASGGFSCTSLPHALYSLIQRILETLWLSFAYVITQKRKKTQQLRFFKADWEL